MNELLRHRILRRVCLCLFLYALVGGLAQAQEVSDIRTARTLLKQLVGEVQASKTENKYLNQKLGEANAYLSTSQAEVGVLQSKITYSENEKRLIRQELDVIKPKYENLSKAVNKGGFLVAGIIAILAAGWLAFGTKILATGQIGFIIVGGSAVLMFGITFGIWSWFFRSV